MKVAIISLSALVVGGAAYFVFAGRVCGCASDDSLARNFSVQVIPDRLERYYATFGRYPTTEEGLAALLQPLKGDKESPYAGKNIAVDPWGHAFQYRFPAQKSSAKYDVWSLGPDGKPGTDDIGNWSKPAEPPKNP